MDYTAPVYSISYKFAQQHPPLLPSYANITYPFENNVWLLIFLSIIAMSICYSWSVKILQASGKIGMQVFVPYAILIGQNIKVIL